MSCKIANYELPLLSAKTNVFVGMERLDAGLGITLAGADDGLVINRINCICNRKRIAIEKIEKKMYNNIDLV